MSLERGSTPRPDARIRIPICRVPPHHPVSRIIQAQDEIARRNADTSRR